MSRATAAIFILALVALMAMAPVAATGCDTCHLKCNGHPCCKIVHRNGQDCRVNGHCRHVTTCDKENGNPHPGGNCPKPFQKRVEKCYT
jgi:hypothetical protein